MEYKYFYNLVSMYMPPGPLGNNKDFRFWLLKSGETMMYELAEQALMTLPAPRTKFYESTDYFETQRKVTKIANQIVSELGFYPV